MRRPVIGIPMQTLVGVLGERQPMWSIGQRYLEALVRAGGIPWPIPAMSGELETIRSIFSRLDGLLLTGGSDIEPQRYGESPRPECGATDPARDAVELELVLLALDANRPVLAICRGLQMLNVACGGTLYQDIPTQVPAALKHDYTARQGHLDRTGAPHDVAIKPGSRLARLLGTSITAVNSIHHQAIKDLGQNLVATAFATDGIIEAIEQPDKHFVLGVQWHPEELLETQPIMARLFDAFIQAS